MKRSRRNLPDVLWLSVWLAIAACSEESTDPTRKPPRIVQGDSGSRQLDASVAADAGLADSAAGTSVNDAGDVEGPPRTVVGISPTPTAGLADAGVASPGDMLFEEIELLALGIEATHLIADDFDAVRAAAERFSARRVSTVVSLQVVSGRRSLRARGSVSWDLDDFMPAVDALLEQPLRADYLAIGSALELYRDAAQKPERLEFTDFVTAAITAAKEHKSRPAALKVGFNTRLQSWLTAEAQPWLEQWATVADFAGISWLPVDSNGRALSPSAATAQLREFFARAEKLEIPVLLQEVAYPSATAAGGSAVAQAAFFDRLFDFVGQEESKPSFIAVSALNDPEPAWCARAASDFGAQHTGPFNEAWCSIGLRDRDLTPKPAYYSVIDGLARFSSR